MPRKHKNIATDIRNNSAKQCKAPNCTHPRYRVGGYCTTHTSRRYHYGGPNGRPIKLKEYEVERIEVGKFIDEHIDHPAIAAALKWLQGWMVASYNGDTSLPAHRDFARLHHQCIAPVDVLKATASLWVYSQRRPAVFPEDLQLTYALSLAVLGLVPCEKRAVAARVGSPAHRYRTVWSAVGRREIGARLRRSLMGLYVNISEGLRHQEAQQRAAADALRVPFITTITTVQPAGTSEGKPRVTP